MTDSGNRRASDGCDNGFAGSSAVVTGAGQGIGAAIARGLAAKGRARRPQRPPRGDARRGLCRRSGRPAARPTAASATSRTSRTCDELMALAAGERGVIEILVNNAGIAGPTAPLAEVTLEEWNETIAVNLTGVFLACKAALPYLERAEHGKIVTIGSVTGKQPLPNRTPYAAAKLGVVG